MNVRGWQVIGLVLAVLWLFVRGVEPAPAAVADSFPLRVLAGVAGQFLFGLVVGVPTAYVFRRTFPDRMDPLRGLRVVPQVLAYFLVFVRELVIANLDLTYRVLAPGPPIDPEVIYVPLRVESELAVTTIANTITLTPGTVTLDHDPAANALYVHVVDGRDLQSIVDPIRTWEDYALTIFDDAGGTRTERPQVLVTGDEVRDTPSDADGGSGAGSNGGETSGS